MQNNPKLTSKQKEIITTIKTNGKYPISNAQNPTILKLIKLGVVDYDSSYDNLVLTESGKKLVL